MRFVITAVLATTTSCASLGSTSELPGPRLYRRPHGSETFPALTIRPSDVAATLTPEGRLRASTQLLPQPHWPSSLTHGLGAFIPTVALSTPFPELLVGQLSTLQCSLYVAAPSVASPTVPPTSAPRRASGTFTSGLPLRESPPRSAGQRYRGKLGNSPGRIPTDWASDGTGYTSKELARRAIQPNGRSAYPPLAAAYSFQPVDQDRPRFQLLLIEPYVRRYRIRLSD